MGQIRKQRCGIIDSEEPEIRYCPICLKTDYLSALGPLIQRLNQPLPSDSENWLECRECREIFPRYEIQKETDIGIAKESIDNPFDTGHSIVGLGNKIKQIASQKNMQRLRDRIDQEKDLDIKQELRKGILLP
ncbi:MAG: hypothetical protein ACRD93_03065 [Nitrososphaeraceae archaeon]